MLYVRLTAQDDLPNVGITLFSLGVPKSQQMITEHGDWLKPSGLFPKTIAIRRP
jgi:hypothetical protein